MAKRPRFLVSPSFLRGSTSNDAIFYLDSALEEKKYVTSLSPVYLST